MCDGCVTNQINIHEKSLFWRVSGESLSFYKTYGNNNCQGCTSWCLKHCYMNMTEFLKENRNDILSITKMPNYDLMNKIPFDEEINKVKYVTFFASGTISSEEDKKFIIETIKRYPNKIYRIFTRNLFGIEDFYGNQIILSVDMNTDKNLLEKALKNKNINIAIIKHPENEDLIKKLKLKVKTLIDCNSCLNCLNKFECKNLCFKEIDRFLLLQNYIEN